MALLLGIATQRGRRPASRAWRKTAIERLESRQLLSASAGSDAAADKLVRIRLAITDLNDHAISSVNAGGGAGGAPGDCARSLEATQQRANHSSGNQLRSPRSNHVNAGRFRRGQL